MQLFTHIIFIRPKIVSINVSPDGQRYLASVKQRVARPFHLRWLLPFLLKDNVENWAKTSRGAVIAIAILSAIYCHNPWMVVIGFLPGIEFNWRYPVLVDAPAMALALLAAVVAPHSIWLAIIISLISGCVKETAPLWAAIYAWNPFLLIGLVVVGIRWLQKQGEDVLDEHNLWILQHPIQASRMYNKGRWTDPFFMLTPWGGIILGAGSVSAQVVTALVAGYGQILLATDVVRLYQWAAPVLALGITDYLPLWVTPFVALSVIFNPWRGNGG